MVYFKENGEWRILKSIWYSDVCFNILCFNMNNVFSYFMFAIGISLVGLFAVDI